MESSGLRRWALPALSAVGALVIGTLVLVPSAYASVTVPGAPRGVVATPGNESAVVKWTAPLHNGGSGITRYLVTASPGPKTCTWMSGPLTCTVHGLTNGDTYTITVKAKNAMGFGPASAPVRVKVGVPLAPTGVKAIGGYAEATVSWTAPANNGSPITRYTVTSSPGGKTCTTTGTTSCTVTGLTNEITYTFKVTATNKWGTGAASAPSAAVSPPVVRTIQPIQAPPEGAVPGSQVTPFGICSDGTHVWVLGYYFLDAGVFQWVVVELHASNGSWVQTIPVGISPIGGGTGAISCKGGLIWAVISGNVQSNETDGLVAEIDGSDGAVVATINVGAGPDAISSDGTDVWVANGSDNTVSEIDIANATVVNTISVGNDPDSISSDGTDVWVANYAASTVTEIDASTASIVHEAIPVGDEPEGICSDGIHVWVANYGGNSVTELKASDGAGVTGFAVGNGPDAISCDGTHVWVANSLDDTVTEINPGGPVILAVLPVGNDPVAIFSDGIDVWVANQGDNTFTEIAA